MSQQKLYEISRHVISLPFDEELNIYYANLGETTFEGRDLAKLVAHQDFHLFGLALILS